MVYGVTFRQGRNNFKIDASLLTNLVTENKELPESAKIDLIVALITLKCTQSNSVCFAYDGRPSAWVPGSSPESTVPVWLAPRRTPGSCGSIPRPWRSPSGKTWAAPTGTMSLTAISMATKRTCAPRVSGKLLHGAPRAPYR